MKDLILMMKPKKRRLYLVLGGMSLLGAATCLVIFAFMPKQKSQRADGQMTDRPLFCFCFFKYLKNRNYRERVYSTFHEQGVAVEIWGAYSKTFFV